MEIIEFVLVGLCYDHITHLMQLVRVLVWHMPGKYCFPSVYSTLTMGQKRRIVWRIRQVLDFHRSFISC